MPVFTPIPRATAIDRGDADGANSADEKFVDARCASTQRRRARKMDARARPTRPIAALRA